MESADVEHATAVYLRARAVKEHRPGLLDEAKKHLDRALVIEPKHKAARDDLAAHSQWVARFAGAPTASP